MKWSDIDYEENRIHIQRNAVKITGEDIIAKDTKTAAWDRYVYFSPETESLLKEYRRECVWQADAYENHILTLCFCQYKSLVILRMHLKIGLGMGADGADLQRGGAYQDMSAVPALPGLDLALLEDLLGLHVAEQGPAVLLVVLLNFRHRPEFRSQLRKPSFLDLEAK